MDVTALSDDARRYLEQHRVARLATASGDGQPHVIPFCYALLGNSIYFVIDEKPKRTLLGLKRLENIRANPQVALVVDDYSDDWAQLSYLLVRGRAVIVDDRSEYELALQQLRIRYPPYEAMSLTFDTNPMVRITPERVKLWRSATG